MKSAANIPGWLILDEKGIPGVWFRTRDEARQVARESGVAAAKVVMEAA